MVGRYVSRLLRQDTIQAGFGLDQSLIPVSHWDRGGANQFNINGTLTLGGRPVGGVRIGFNTYTLPTPTADDGTFTLRGDRTILSRLRLHVVDASAGTIDGADLTEGERAALAALEDVIETAYTITVEGEPTAAPGGTVTGRLTYDGSDDAAPLVALWGYELRGTILDEDGSPLASAYVSVSDDEGETWAVSGATGEDGHYSLRFFPVPGSEMSVRISTAADFYESAEEIVFDSQTSAEMDIVAARSHGMVMGTGANGDFAVTDIPGAEYVGYVAGVAVDDVPVAADLTWPDERGTFTVILPDELPDGELTFFQSRLRFFSEADIVPGGPVPADAIPATLDELTPRNLPPALTGGQATPRA